MDNITMVPFDLLVSEGRSQRNRYEKEVMEALFALLPREVDKNNDSPSFVLADGTRCWLKAFSAPGVREDNNQLQYGFDVKFPEGHPLAHLEFTVKCTGWERSFV